jgi:hemerythrin-like domain-containing protein
MVIDDLHQDHINISRVLDLLEQQLARMKADERPDYFLMSKVVEYIQEYPDTFHHPQEDAIFTVYLESHEKGQDELESLRREHEELSKLTTDLREAVDCMFHGGVVCRDDFVWQVEDYIQRQRAHMDREESEVFPMLEKTLTAADWARVEEIMPNQADPVFGSSLKSQYDTLYRRIFS